MVEVQGILSEKQRVLTEQWHEVLILSGAVSCKPVLWIVEGEEITDFQKMKDELDKLEGEFKKL